MVMSVCDGLAVFSRSCADVGDPLLPSCDAELSGMKDECYAPVLVSTSPGVYCAAMFSWNHFTIYSLLTIYSNKNGFKYLEYLIFLHF